MKTLMLSAAALIPMLVPFDAVSQPLATLQPGAFRTITQEIPVNIVFVGYEKGSGPREVDEAKFLSGLPQTYRVRNRYPAAYGRPADAGLAYSYRYRLVYAEPAYEDALFAFLSANAVPRGLTAYQQVYNGQTSRSLTIPGNANHWIAAGAVEQWLASNPPPVVNTAEYTVFFINWYGRPDFKHHVYVKSQADPDTGFNFGEALSSRKLIAWGGTPPANGGPIRRVWFYDLSAGPEYWTANFNLDNPDIDGNGVLDYRMPPVWEYGNLSAYRPFNDLSGDLAKVLRYVALDLLFTTSPLYNPAISAPELPARVQFDVNMFDEGAQNSTPLLKGDMLAASAGRLQPLTSFSTQVNRYPLAGRTSDVFRCFAFGPSCFGSRLFGISFGDLFLYFTDHLQRYLDGDGDYEIPIFTFNASAGTGLLGFADDNWSDGAQSYVFGFLDPGTRPYYGYTTTLIHETGHHIGMSHPHDGYDFERNIDFSATNSFYFAWSGDESATIMSYMDLNTEFSQFDRDNMNRYLTAAYINQANQVLARVLASPRAGAVAGMIASSDGWAGAALAAHAASDWALAASRANAAYRRLLEAAAAIHVPIEPQAWQADYRGKGRSYMSVDPVDYRRLAP